jgi:hypothetical protein
LPWMPGDDEAWLIAGCRCGGSGWMATSSFWALRLLIEMCCEESLLRGMPAEWPVGWNESTRERAR